MVGEEATTNQEELGSDPDLEGEAFSGSWGLGTCPADIPNCQYVGIPVDDELAREQEAGDTMSGSFSANNKLSLAPHKVGQAPAGGCLAAEASP